MGFDFLELTLDGLQVHYIFLEELRDVSLKKEGRHQEDPQAP
jgi:hypothetical protein